MWEYTTVIIALLVFIVIREVLFLREKSRLQSSNKDLLDRLMAFNRDVFDRYSYAEIAKAEIVKEQEKAPWEPNEYDTVQVSPEEDS